jgi:hypothetical protein
MDFSGLLGGVLKGDILSDAVCSEVGWREPPFPWRGFDCRRSTFGLSALLTGGGTEALLDIPMGDVPLTESSTGVIVAERAGGEPGLVRRGKERGGLRCEGG